MDKNSVKPSEGKLGILCVGLGAVSSTFITGVLMIRKGMGKPIGSITQMAKIRVGRGDKAEYKHVSEIVPMPALDDIVFGVLGLVDEESSEGTMGKVVSGLMDMVLESRAAAKAAKDWNTSDHIRDCLKALGIQVKDTRDGAEWTLSE